jgi:hypothetical protein
VRAWALIAVVVLTGVPVAGCGVLGIGGTGGCRVTADNPHQSKTPTDIVGKARVTCSVAADEVMLTVRLERQVGDVWVAPQGNEDLRLAPIVAGERYTVQQAIPCMPGTFRTAARGRGTLDGRPSQSVAWTYSRFVTDPCEK